MWRYAKESVRRKVLTRELSDEFIEATLLNPDSVVPGKRNRLIAQKLSPKAGLGKLLIRVVMKRLKARRLSSRLTGLGQKDIGGNCVES